MCRERALLTREVRAANVVAVGSVACYRLGQDDFDEILGSLREVMDHHTGMQILSRSNFVTSLSHK